MYMKSRCGPGYLSLAIRPEAAIQSQVSSRIYLYTQALKLNMQLA